MTYTTDATVERSVKTLRNAIEAAENSNQAGENFVVAAAVAPALLDALIVAAEELEYFVEFARRQCEFEGDEEAGLAAVRNARAAISKARGAA